MTVVQSHRSAAAILGLYLILAVIYSLITPIFEASDEISHYPVVEHIATTGQLPEQQPGVDTLWEQEGSQPPLYYLIASGLTFWIDTSDLEAVQWRNPHAKLGVTLDPDNKNMIIHTEAERFPWQRTILAVHLIRFFSIALGSATVVLTYLLAREVTPEDSWVAILSTALVAFNPMFLFISGSVNNDNLIILLSTGSILLCVRIFKEGFTLRRAVILAVLTALATITKISGLTLVPLIGLTLIVRAWRHGEWRPAIFSALTLVTAWLIVASWWYVRNLSLYGELLGLETHVAIAGARRIDLVTLLASEWYGFWVSYWALFGAVNILAGGEIYLFYSVLSIAAVAGIVIWVRKQLKSRHWITLVVASILIVYVLIVLLGVIRWTMVTYASQGRLMFPAIAPISVLMALGIIHIEAENWRRYIAIVTLAMLVMIASLAPFRYIAPAYALPDTVATVPDSATPVYVRFDGLELLAVETYSVTVNEGERVPVTLYWRARSEMTRNYSIFLHALGRDAVEIGKIDSYPGGGILPTTAMQPGVIVQDHYSIELNSDFEAPTTIRIQVGVGIYGGGHFAALAPILENGQRLTSVTVDAGVAYPQGGCSVHRRSSAPVALFGDFASMWADPLPTSALPGDHVPVILIWDRDSDTLVNWTVFVHMLDTNDLIAAQADAPPLNGFYPTSLWRRPCQVIDLHDLTVPPALPSGEYRIVVGLYDASDPFYSRAPAVDTAGTPYPDQAVSLGTIQVAQP